MTYKPLSPTGTAWFTTFSTNGSLWSNNNGATWNVLNTVLNTTKSCGIWTNSGLIYHCNGTDSFARNSTGSGSYISSFTGFGPRYINSTTNKDNFIGLGGTSLISITRDTGFTWKNYSLTTVDNWRSISYGGGIYCAIASGSNANVSSDGMNWTQSTLPVSQDWSSITYNNNKFIAVAKQSKIGAFSFNGIDWTTFMLPIALQWNEIQFDEITGKTIIIPSNSTYIAISDDGLSYKLYDILTSTVKPQVCAFGSGIILVAGETTEANSIIVNSGTFTTPLINPLGSGINIQNFFIKT